MSYRVRKKNCKKADLNPVLVNYGFEIRPRHLTYFFVFPREFTILSSAELVVLANLNYLHSIFTLFLWELLSRNLRGYMSWCTSPNFNRNQLNGIAKHKEQTNIHMCNSFYIYVPISRINKVIDWKVLK